MAYKTPPGYGRSGSRAKPKELMLHGSLSRKPRYAFILLADEQGISSEIFRCKLSIYLYLASLSLAEQEELVVRARSTLGALVAGIVVVDESKQAELLINIL